LYARFGLRRDGTECWGAAFPIRWGYCSSFLSSDILYCSLEKPAIIRLLSYMYPSTRHTGSQAIQRSQSTPNVGVLPTEKRRQPRRQPPRRTKTSIDFFAAPPRGVVDRERRVDPFNLEGFFPSGLRQSDQEPSGWWRDEGQEGSEELASELAMLEGDSSSLESQRILFSREDQPADAVIKREDKLGVLTICAHSHFMSSNSVIMASGAVTGGRAIGVNGIEESLHSPYINDEACCDEAVRLAYERRRRQQLEGGNEQLLEKTTSLFYEGEEEEAAGWFGLMMMRI
jgi:hypothetical protein